MIAAVLGLEGQRVLADEIQLDRLVGGRGQQRRLGQQLGLQRQQIAEDAGQRDRRTSIRGRPRLLERHQLRAAQPAIAVVARLGAHQPQRLRDRAALGLQVVGAPQHHRDGFGQRPAVLGMRVPAADRPAARRPARRRRSGCGTDRSRADCGRSAARRWCAADRRPAPAADSRRPARAMIAGNFVIRRPAAHRAAARRSGSVIAGGIQHLRALARAFGGVADDVQAVRDQRVFQFQQRAPQALDLARPRRPRPARPSARSTADRLRLDQRGERGALLGIGVRLQRAPAVERGLQIEQAAIQPGLGDRRRQIADQRRAGAALGDRAFGRIVRGIEIEVRQIADQPVRPAVAGQAGLLAGHELQRAMGAEMQHRVRRRNPRAIQR